MTRDVSRRLVLKTGAGGAFALALAASTSTAASAATTVSLGSYGSPSSADNANALTSAIAAAGPGGTVTVPAGVWKMSSVNINTPVTIVGIDSVTTRFAFTSGFYGMSFNAGSNGSSVRNLGLYSIGGATSSFVHVGADVTLTSCDFYEPVMFANDVYSGTLTVTSCRYIGQAKSIGTGIQVSGSNANLTVTNSMFSGLYQGHVANGGGNVTARSNTYLGLWFFSNPTICTGVVASATSSGAMTRAALAKTDFAPNATAVAWKTISSAATVSPVAGKSGWFTISGVTPEARMMVRNGTQFGIVLDVSGNTARIPYWHTFGSCYPRATPTSAQAKMIVERPYIGRVSSVSSSGVKVVSWHAGSKGAYEVPPAGARLQINDKTSYQCFTTNATSSFRVDACTVVASWADSISSIGGRNVNVTNCTIYDGQDVGITLEQITNGCAASGNTAYRSGTAAIYIGSGSAQVSNNRSFGANMMTDNAPSYSAFTIQGANWANVWSNTATYGGAPFEISGISIDGYDGQDNTSPASQQLGPFATNLHINANSTKGYPKHDVTMWGTKAFVEKGHYSWQSGTRFNLLMGATQAMVTP